jgi:hypothetical protein
MKWISPIFSDARNKLGGNVFARNRAGVYARAKVDPSNPKTAFQQANRATFATIVSTWKTLTPAQRLAWNNVAESNTLTDSLGQTSRPSGFQLFTSRNRNLSLFGASLITSPAVDSNDLIEAGSPRSPTVTTAAGHVTGILFDTPDLGTGDYFWVWRMTAPLSPGITFVAPHLYRQVFSDNSDDGPWDVTAFWSGVFGTSLAVGQRIGTIILAIDGQSGRLVETFKFLTAATL